MSKSGQRRAPTLGDADLSLSIGHARYGRRLARLQHRLAQIQQAYLLSGDRAVIVFEGWDAAGKGGTIRRISAACDPRSFKVWPIGAPRKYYLERHYLTRFFERLPPHGAIALFDRSWYGRVLVERVEGLIPPRRWQDAYDEINDFERALIRDGARIVKIFMHISRAEQLRRFEERLTNPLKRWKLSYEDFRNRDHWDEYEAAIGEMFARTSTPEAPWLVVPAEDKKYARIMAITEIARRLGRNVDLRPPPMNRVVLDEAGKHLVLEPGLLESLAGRTE